MQIFISRDLKNESVFKKILETNGHLVFGESLIEFAALDFAWPQATDWLFFYSKKGVAFFTEQLKQKSFGNIKLATIGLGTAKAIETLMGLKVDFVGTGDPLTTSKAFAARVAGQTVTFVRALNSKQSVQKRLDSPEKIIDCIVYQNSPKKLNKDINADILVFTSPMNVDSYFQQKKLSSQQKIIVIGKTTAKALHKWEIQDFEIAKEPSEASLAQAVLNIID